MAVNAPRNEAPEYGEVLPEDQARAEVYALLSSLFYQPPSKELLQAIATSRVMCNDDVDSGYCRAWRALQGAAADAETVQEEFEDRKSVV